MTAAHPGSRSTLPRMLITGPLIVIAGLVCWALYVRATNSEHHAYAHGGNPPTYVRIEPGVTYGIAISGGVKREVALGLPPGTLQCTAAAQGQAPGPLQVTPEEQGTDVKDIKATDRIGFFTADRGGLVHITCSGIGPVFIDNATDAPYDWSGVWLVLASVLLAVGLPLTLSGLRRSGRRVDPATARGLEFAGHGETDVVGARPGDDLYAQRQPFATETERHLGGG